MNIRENELVMACSDGTVKVFDLGNIGSISDPHLSTRVSNKPLTALKDSL